MKIAVISDTHGYGGAIQKCVDIVKEYDLFIHLGDNIRDFHEIEKLSGVKGYGVVGNTDIGSEGEEIMSVTIEGKNILITHGHRFHVKRNIDALSYYCEENKIHIGLFGHSHVNSICKINGILYMNPGSVILPRGGSMASYGSISIEHGQVKAEIKHV